MLQSYNTIPIFAMLRHFCSEHVMDRNDFGELQKQKL